MTKLWPRRAAILLPLTALTVALGGDPSPASTPASSSVAAPAAGGAPATATWTGTIPIGTDPTSSCVAGGDTHTVTITLPAGHYGTATTKATFSIKWSDANNDELIRVDGPGGLSEVGDTSATTESVQFIDPPAGDYTVSACPYLSTTAQPYTGKVTLTSTAKGAAGGGALPSDDAHGLAFSASVPSDPQRDIAEPLIEIDPSGRSYTCGPTGFSNASDYANTSDDGGDQFHLLGTEPRGQQGLGGGGDCGLATGVDKNSQGKFQYAYAGLGPLTGFTTSTSADDGRTIENAGPAGNANTDKGGGADRQWLTFLDGNNVLLNYNQQEPRNVVVQKSTDGGLTYPNPAASAVAAGSPDFPGPMRSMPASVVDPGAAAGKRIAFFGWNSSDADFSYVNLSVSDDSGLNWKDCLVRKVPIADGALQAFTVADSDNEGNIYLAYADEKDFHTYLTTLPHDKLKDCDQAISEGTATATATPPSKDPGWSTPVQVDRDAVRTTIFPWLVAGGAPGHVAISYYGTETDGDPNPGSFKASWNVYVDQSTDALSATPHIGQAKATTHPIHYDSICLQGLGCDLSTPAGDRGLGDFFAIDLDPVTHKLQLVYDNTAKRPDDAAGTVAAPMVVTQTAGPSNDGGTITPEADRATVRTSAPDPAGDALTDYSRLGPPGGAQTKVPALDLLDEQVGPEVNPATGASVPNGGFTATTKVADLSDGALQSAAGTGSLVYAFRFVNGYQPAAAVAKWSPASGFTFGYDRYTTGSTSCGSDSDKCEIYPGATPIPGKVDQAAGTITLSVPRSLLTPLTGPTGPGQRPAQKAPGTAVPGDRFYDATTFSFANPSPDPSTQSFMVNADNVRAMDFLLPEPAQAPTTTTTTTTTTDTTTSTQPPATTSTTTTPPPAGGSPASSSASSSSRPAPQRKAATAKRTSAHIRILRVVRRGSRVYVTLRTTNGSVRGARITLSRRGRTVAHAVSKRIGSTRGLTVVLHAARGQRLVRRGKLVPGRYRIAVRAIGASKARAGGVVLLT